MKNWYLLAYDIRDNKRLRKVHYFLKKQATALQNSVFLLHVDRKTLDSILAGVKERTKGTIDDVRLYPISNPHIIWAAGKQVGVMQSLYTGNPNATESGFKRLFAGLFGRD
jgi:CRISPR-associated protein Cas2